MELILTIILFIIINRLSSFIIEKVKELIQIIKIRKSVKNLNLEDFNINKNVDQEFWDDIEDEDISTEWNNWKSMCYCIW